MSKVANAARSYTGFNNMKKSRTIGMSVHPWLLTRILSGFPNSFLPPISAPG